VTASIVENPFTAVYSAIWDMIADWPGLNELVRLRNQIRYDSPTDRNVNKRDIASADIPELVLVADSLTSNTHNTCSTSMCTRQYSILVSSGDFRYSAVFAQLEWLLFATSHDFNSRLGKLVWPFESDWHFVKRWDLPSGSVGESDPKLNRKITGWAGIWTLEVEMHFRRSDIRDLFTSGSSGS
jgi:hypothetical protein